MARHHLRDIVNLISTLKIIFSSQKSQAKVKYNQNRVNSRVHRKSVTHIHSLFKLCMNILHKIGHC